MNLDYYMGVYKKNGENKNKTRTKKVERRKASLN